MSDVDPFEFSFPSSGGSGRQPSDGPVNWQVAEQVATWFVRETTNLETALEIPDFDELFRVVEMRIEGLVPELPAGSGRIFEPVLLTPAEWAKSSVGEFNYVLDLLGRHLSAAAGPVPDEMAVPIQAMMAPMLPVLLGGQFGLLLGKMATWVYSGFDVLLPRTKAPRPIFVPITIVQAARSFSLDAKDAGLWACLHEYAHLRQFLVPWVRQFLATEVERAIASVEFSPDAVAEQLADLDPSDPSSVEAFAQDPTGLLNALMVPAPPEVTERLRAAVAIFETAAEHAAAVTAVEIASEPDRAREMMKRHHIEHGSAETFLLRLCGVMPSPKELASGLFFCQFVTAEAGFDKLARLWASPESLPTFEEMSEPQRWLSRTSDRN
jgi:putative hydrolase